jgi:hypothetical protein
MRKVMFSILGCLIGAMVFAKTVDSIPEPEFMNEVYYYDKSNIKLIPLEKAVAEIKSKMRIVGGGSSAYAIGGEKSVTRINQQGASFVITISNGSMIDPSMTLMLYRFESRKGRREAVMNVSGGSGSENAVEIKFKRVKEGTFEIIVPGSLAKGEYGFISSYSMKPGGGMTAYAFGVD